MVMVRNDGIPLSTVKTYIYDNATLNRPVCEIYGQREKTQIQTIAKFSMESPPLHSKQ